MPRPYVGPKYLSRDNPLLQPGFFLSVPKFVLVSGLGRSGIVGAKVPLAPLTGLTLKCHLSVIMKTLTITSARQNLGAWLARAAEGEEIGIVCGAQVIALRPVAIHAADYAEQEYRLNQAELAKAAKKIHEEIDAAETFEFTGDLRAAGVAASRPDQALSQPRRKAGARGNRRGQRRVASVA